LQVFGAEFSLDGMLASSDLDKSLQELEQSNWGEPTYDSHLVTTVHRLRRVPLRQFSVEDLRIMIGQSIGLPYLVPLALEHLRENSLVEGDFYPGDLLKNMLTADPAFWREHPEWREEVREIAARTLTRLHSLTPEDQHYSDVVLESLTGGWKIFESAPQAV
jgi:CDI immunity proteins